MTIDTAMVLAAGLGTRIRALDPQTPKPLIKVAGKPLIDYALATLAEGGVARAVVNVHHRADQLEEHLRSVREPKIELSDERDELLETGGGILKALPKLGREAFFSSNTDAILLGGAPVEALKRAWSDETDVLLLLVPKERTSGYAGRGDFSLDEQGRVLPLTDEQPLVFTGLQLLRRSLFEGAPVEPVSTRVFWAKAQQAGRMRGLIYSGEWMHVGDPEGHAAAEERLRRS
jgi:MurNAc alpha-1-phosphate uridylyltransferase